MDREDKVSVFARPGGPGVADWLTDRITRVDGLVVDLGVLRGARKAEAES